MPLTFYGYSDFFAAMQSVPLQMLQFLEREVESWQGLQVLDTACGNGELAQALENCGAKVTALESDPTVLAQAMELSRRTGQVRRPFYQLGTLRHLPGEERSFQMILCLNNGIATLENEQAYRDFLSEAAKRLVPEGRLVLQLFNYDRILDYQDYKLEDIAVEGSGIRVLRSLVPDDRGGLILHSRVEILRRDAMEFSRFQTRLFPVRRQQLSQMLRECGYRAVHFYGDTEGGAWKADSERTLLVAIKN